MLVALSQGGETFSESAPPASPSTEFNQNGDARQHAPLPSSIQNILDMTLAREDMAKKIGTVERSFPLPVCDAGKCGAVNRDGTYAVVPAYERVESFFEGRAVVRIRDGYGYKFGYVDDTGRAITEPLFAVADRFSRGFAQVDVEGKSALIDHEGHVVLRPKFGFIVPFNDEVFWVAEQRDVREGNNGEKDFLFDRPAFGVRISGGPTISRTYIMPRPPWGLVDRSGAWIRRPEFSAIRVFNDADAHFMWVKTDVGWGLMRPDLSWQVEPRLQNVGHIADGLAGVELDGRFGFVDETGRVVIEPKFDDERPFSGPYAPARRGKLFGLIDRTGAWSIEPKYDAIFAGGILIPRTWWNFKVGEKYGLLDDSLREVIGPQLDQPAAMCVDGRIITRVNKKWKLFAHDGTPIDNDRADCNSPITFHQN